MQEIRLNEYRAQINGLQLTLGTWDSYGIETLKIIPGTGWEGLTITATFVTPEVSTRVLVPQDGLLPVPQEATAHSLPSGSQGQIVFTGVAEGIQRISTNVLYIVSDHAPIDGEDSHPTPSEFSQFVAQVQDAANNAEKSAAEAANSASAADGSAIQAGQSAENAAKSAQDVEATLEKVQTAGPDALQSVSAAKSDALAAIDTTQTAAVDSVQKSRQSAVQAVAQAGDAQVHAVNTAGQAQQTAIQQTGTEQVSAITQAGDAKLDEIKAANAILPKPTEADEGKAPIAQPDGTYALQEVTVDAYAKAEADARYAPIEAAIKVSGKGTGLVSLSPTVGWYQQGLSLYGKSWNDGTPSVEQEVPIQSAGQSGTVDVTVFGANLVDPASLVGQSFDGITVVGSEDGEILLSGTASGQADFYIFGGILGNEKIGLPSGPLGIALYGAPAGVFIRYIGEISRDVNRPQVVPYSAEIGCKIILRVSAGTQTNIAVKLIVSVGDTVQPFQPYTAQQLHIPTPSGLPGIPVASGGSWTDENGQAWVSDVVDLEEETKTQNCAKYFPQNDIFSISLGGTGENAQTIFVRKRVQNGTNPHTRAVMCNFLSKVDSEIWNSDEECYNYALDGYLDFRILKSRLSSADVAGVKAFCASIGAEFLYALYEPIVTPLDSATVASYRALTTYPGTTNVLAPDCGIEAAAVGDATQVIANIEKKISDAVTSAVALAQGGI